MRKTKIYTIDGKEYIATKIVKLNNKKYQELFSADIMHPDILYVENVDGRLSLVEDWDIYCALREKYAIDKRSLNGQLVLYGDIETKHSKRKFMSELKHIPDLKNISLRFEKTVCGGTVFRDVVIDSGEHKGEWLFSEHTTKGKKVNVYSDFFVEKANAMLAKLFENDVKEFSAKGAKAFGTILTQHGIYDHKKWFEEKFRQTTDPTKPSYSYMPISDENFDIVTKAVC